MQEAPKRIRSDWQAVDVDGRSMAVYIAEPQDIEPFSTVVVLQEIFGVNAHIRQVADRLATSGYRVAAPDIFYREGERLEARYDQVALGRERKARLGDGAFLEDFRALLTWLRAGHDKQVAVLGFCFGGRLAYLAACATDVARAVVFYGGGIAAGPLAKTASIRCPMLLLFGAEDAIIPLSEIDEIRATLKRYGVSAEMVVYPQAGHGFFCSERADYRLEAASDAWERVLAFLGGPLGHRFALQ